MKNWIKRQFFNLYKLTARLGIHVLPAHYYCPVPNIIELEKIRDVWARKSDMPGIHIDLDEQVDNLKNICLPWQSEYENAKNYREGISRRMGPGFGFIESQALHAVLRHLKPKRIIEVGSGVSTYCTLEALKLNQADTNQNCRLTCIEPYPSDNLKALPGINVIPEKVQTVSYKVFSELEKGDLLFIDSSHTVKPGGDVNYLFLEILPRLAPGVIVHVHDINFPYDYQRMTLQTFLHGTETSLLRAFLIRNDKARIIFCLSHLHYDRKDAMHEVFPGYDPQADNLGMRAENIKPFARIPQHFPSSIYIALS